MALAKPILRSELTDQHITAIAKRINIGLKQDDPLSKYFETRKMDKDKVNVSYRTLIPAPLKDINPTNFVFQENVAPANRDLTYVTVSFAVKSYDTRYEYTSEDVKYNPDSVVKDCSSELVNWGEGIKIHLAASALKSTHSVVTPVLANSKASMMGTFRKARRILDKLHAKGMVGGNYLALMDGDCSDKLTEELIAANYGNSVADASKQTAEDGYIASYKGITAVDPKLDEVFIDADGKHYVFFIAKTDKGANPLAKFVREGDGNAEVIHSPLGSGLMVNAAGDYVPDYNHQKGAIAENLMGIAYAVFDDRFVLRCEITAAQLDAIDITTEMPLNGTDTGGVYQTFTRVAATKKHTHEYDGQKTLPDAVVTTPSKSPAE